MHNNKILFSLVTIAILMSSLFSDNNVTIDKDINKSLSNFGLNPHRSLTQNQPPNTETETPIKKTTTTSNTCPILKEYECHDVKCCKEKYKEKKDYKDCCINRVKKEQQTVNKEQQTVNKKSVKNVDINSKNIAKLSSKVKKMKDLCISIEEELQKLEKKPKQ